jgi:aryl-alcohol dehydrogenase-like predicted oxidoreductase
MQQQRQFGKNGPKVGAIGFGAMSFGGFYGPTTEAESHAALDACLETGTTHWDTADNYGPDISERVLGSYFKVNPGARRRIHLATKGGIRRNLETGTRSFDNSPDYLRKALDASLQRLGIDHIDLYYIHRREQARPIEDVMQTLLTFKQEGKIGGIGFSEVSPASIRRAAAIGAVDAVQSEFSLWTRLPELGVVQACAEIGAALVAFSPLGRGIFTDTVHDIETFAKSDFRRGNPRFIEPNFSYNLKALEALNRFAETKGATPGQIALAWTIAQAPYVIPVPGTRYAKNVRENAGAGAIVLTSAELAELERLLPRGFAHGDRYTEQQYIGPERYG